MYSCVAFFEVLPVRKTGKSWIPGVQSFWTSISMDFRKVVILGKLGKFRNMIENICPQGDFDLQIFMILELNLDLKAYFLPPSVE